jgi:hypothetical protein
MPHAFYSKKAIAFGCGSQIWVTKDGKEVELTGVYDERKDADTAYRWDDKRYLGEVDKFVRTGVVRNIGNYVPNRKR